MGDDGIPDDEAISEIHDQLNESLKEWEERRADVDPQEVLDAEQTLREYYYGGDEPLHRPVSLGGKHLDRIWTDLIGLSYQEDPVRIVIEPETDRPDDHHYQIRFEPLWRGDRDV